MNVNYDTQYHNENYMFDIQSSNKDINGILYCLYFNNIKQINHWKRPWMCTVGLWLTWFECNVFEILLQLQQKIQS